MLSRKKRLEHSLHEDISPQLAPHGIMAGAGDTPKSRAPTLRDLYMRLVVAHILHFVSLPIFPLGKSIRGRAKEKNINKKN